MLNSCQYSGLSATEGGMLRDWTIRVNESSGDQRIKGHSFGDKTLKVCGQTWQYVHHGSVVPDKKIPDWEVPTEICIWDAPPPRKHAGGSVGRTHNSDLPMTFALLRAVSGELVWEEVLLDHVGLALMLTGIHVTEPGLNIGYEGVQRHIRNTYGTVDPATCTFRLQLLQRNLDMVVAYLKGNVDVLKEIQGNSRLQEVVVRSLGSKSNLILPVEVIEEVKLKVFSEQPTTLIKPETPTSGIKNLLDGLEKSYKKN